MATIHMSSPITLQNDMDLLNMLTSPTSPVLRSSTNNSNAAGGRTSRYKRREAPLDPLLLVAAISSGPHVTRHHYHHHHTAPTSLLEDLLPDSAIPNNQSSTSTTSSTIDSNMSSGQVGSKYKSQQAPRSQRVKQNTQGEDSDKENQRKPLASSASANLPPRRPRGSSLIQLSSFSATTSHNAIISSSTFAAGYATNAATGPAGSASTTAGMATAAAPSPPFPFTLGSNPVLHTLPQAPLHVQCMARTRIPTPHGPAFLHLYRNNKDNKEHLAFVIDPVQLQSEGASAAAALASMQHEHRFIRSASLDAKWSEDETELDRLTRGAYIGRLTSQAQLPAPASSSLSASDVSAHQQQQQQQQALVSGWNSPPLVRIHSECFTGETIGSMRCDCGEQLDEALRLISLSAAQPGGGRGAVIYLRQEGRGIGLLNKIRAYNLQDMGHDTVQANLLLGHGADERRYDIAAAIMRDLGLLEVELLTNNPDKVVSLEKEGVKVMKRREMVPRTWQMQQHQHQHHQCKDEHCCGGHKMDGRLPGATLIGGGATHGPELEKYLRTKIERMGHMLELPREAA
ncbi:hypothetical protein CPB86DRAFT_782580 [Serendipita vermifera]|nr:hypothetical protein CPB86DRAFT_782580 [Serendipita vermifera]